MSALTESSQLRFLSAGCSCTVPALLVLGLMHICLQARMVLEDPGCVDSIIQDWQSVLPATLNKWKIEQKDLQIFFEDFRNNLLQNKEVTKPQKHC